jgi:hypothetical protein
MASRKWEAMATDEKAAVLRRQSDQNAAIIRRGYEAFNSGDMKTLTEIFNENAVWHTPGRSSLAGDHQGREAIFAYFGRLVQDTGGTFQATLQHLLADDEGRVVGIQHNSAERDGKHLAVDAVLVFQLEDGRLTDGREYIFDLDAWDEFWS